MQFLNKLRALPWYTKLLWTAIIFAVATFVVALVNASINDISLAKALKAQVNSALIAFVIVVVVVLIDGGKK